MPAVVDHSLCLAAFFQRRKERKPQPGARPCGGNNRPIVQRRRPPLCPTLSDVRGHGKIPPNTPYDAEQTRPKTARRLDGLNRLGPPLRASLCAPTARPAFAERRFTSKRKKEREHRRRR